MPSTFCVCPARGCCTQPLLHFLLAGSTLRGLLVNTVYPDRRCQVLLAGDQISFQPFNTSMPFEDVQPITITVDDTPLSGFLQAPPEARACYVLAHGAGAGMTHPFMAAVADGLAERRIATLRYQFPYMERRSKRPDPPKVAHATVRAAVVEAS